MKSFARRDRFLAIGLSALAGYGDTTGFLATGGTAAALVVAAVARMTLAVAPPAA